MNDHLYTCQPTQNLSASISIPGSKSLTNRALLIAALAQGQSTLENTLDCEDSSAMLKALGQLGIKYQHDESVVTIKGCNGRWPHQGIQLFANASGTVARFLTAALHLGQGNYTLDGDHSISNRPLSALIDCLKKQQMLCTPTTCKSLPIDINANGFSGGDLTLDTSQSSQFTSALMITGAYGKSPLSLTTKGPQPSAGYLQLTQDVMKAFGCTPTQTPQGWTVPNTGYQGCHYFVESDASSASYFLALAAITQSSIEVKGLSLSSAQPDIGGVKALETMGSSIEETQDGIRIHGPSKEQGLKSIDIDMNTMTDIVPTLAVTALFAKGASRFRNVEHMRHKECDRLYALITEFKKAGAEAFMDHHDLVVKPAQNLKPCIFETYDDHRMAMALSLIGCREAGFQIANPEVTHKTFPEYFTQLNALIKS